MLLIYGALAIGGIETFFVRLAKERFRRNLTTKLILLETKTASDAYLLTEIQKYAEVYYAEDLFKILSFLGRKIPLITPLNKKKLDIILKDVQHVHVTGGLTALIAYRIKTEIKKDLILTVGFYHSLEYLWGNYNIPFFEKINRKFVLNTLPKKNLFLFSETMISFYQKKNIDLRKSQTFRIGVIERTKNPIKKEYTSADTLKVCSVGRLVSFKSYNTWMIDVVCELKGMGVNITYDIYGDGALHEFLEKKIRDLGLDDIIKLKNQIPYSQFHETVLRYDLFVGSGTAIVEASSLGVCSIIGIESIIEPKTYGFFSDFSTIDYNISNLDLKKVNVIELILDFKSLTTTEKSILSFKHIESINSFYIDTCNNNFERFATCEDQEYEFKIPKLLYSLDFLRFMAMIKFNKKSLYQVKTNEI